MNIHSVAKNICRAYSAHKSQSININKRMTFYRFLCTRCSWQQVAHAHCAVFVWFVVVIVGIKVYCS